jgi:uncharacterized membrane protein YphA (DoxX/SURF4 family)
MFIFAGYEKVSNMAGTVGFFSSLGIPVFLTYIVAYAELIGGVLIVLGLWTCLSAAVLAVIMLVAVWLTRAGGLQVMMYPLAVFAGLVSLMGSCGGKYSVRLCTCCTVKSHNN